MLISVSAARGILRLSRFILASALLCLLTSSLAATELTPASHKSSEAASLMQLSSAWKDQNGSDFLWKDIKGQAFLVAMVYTRCERSCPLIISEVNGIVNGLPKPLQAKVQILLFTFDPQRDTLEKLKSYAIERKLNPNWKLVRGSEDDAQELAAVLGIRYKKLESGEFAHSNTVTVLDQKGQIYHQQAELFRGRNETIEVLKKLLQ